MKKLRINELTSRPEGHILAGIIPGEHICVGGLSFAPPGSRAHTNDGPGGSDHHVHDDEEVFIVLDGKARMEINGTLHPLVAGDVCIVEPGEDHHMISDESDPSVHIWFHAGPHRHEGQSV